jgi:hypothetical protein
MSAYRKKPELGKKYSIPSRPKSDDDPMYCVRLPLIIVVAYFVLSAIARVNSNSGSKLDQIICYGTLICIVIIMFPGARYIYLNSQMAAVEKKRWKNTCVSAELTIINRHKGGVYDDGYSYDRYDCCLDLEMNSDQIAVSPTQTIVSVNVSDCIYKRLENCNTIRIFYLRESPMNFLLEDEL